MMRKYENMASRIPFISVPTPEMEWQAVLMVRKNTTDQEFPLVIEMLGLSHLIDN
jgi:hypothetical protein